MGKSRGKKNKLTAKRKPAAIVPPVSVAPTAVPPQRSMPPVAPRPVNQGIMPPRRPPVQQPNPARAQAIATILGAIAGKGKNRGR